MSEPIEIEHRDLRSAIEFAVALAEEANRGKRSLPYPKELRAHFGATRIPTGALGRLRRSIEADDTFRRTIAVGAVPELVDPIGMLWLQRPTGWEDQVAGPARRPRSRGDRGRPAHGAEAGGEASSRRRAAGRAGAGRSRRAVGIARCAPSRTRRPARRSGEVRRRRRRTPRRTGRRPQRGPPRP